MGPVGVPVAHVMRMMFAALMTLALILGGTPGSGHDVTRDSQVGAGRSVAT